MQVLFDGDVAVHYRFVWLHRDLEPWLPPPETDLGASSGGQVNGLCGGALPGLLSMVTGTHTGPVRLRVEHHEAAPEVGAGWEDVVEVGFPTVEGATGALTLSTFDDVVAVGAVGVDDLRARWCALGMDEGTDGAAVEADPRERYLLQLWPAPPATDAVLRQASVRAASWHGAARATPAPPPRPTPQDRLEAQPAAEPAGADAGAAQLAQLLALGWGGRVPTPGLLAVGGRTSQLSDLDRGSGDPVVDRLLALPAARQRDLASWAARRACEVAGVLDRPPVAAALAAIDRGDPLREPWTDWLRAYESLVPPQADGAAGVATDAWAGSVESPEAAHRPIAPEATAVDAVLEASHPEPAHAVMGAVDALARGHATPAVVLAEVRGLLDAGAQ